MMENMAYNAQHTDGMWHYDQRIFGQVNLQMTQEMNFPE